MTIAVQELALGVIADIEKYGHYQGLPDQILWGPYGCADGQVCVVVNPTAWPLGLDSTDELSELVRRAAGIQGRPGIGDVSDCLSTDEVLDALWAVAIG